MNQGNRFSSVDRITAIPNLLRLLHSAECSVTLDAMGYQRAVYIGAGCDFREDANRERTSNGPQNFALVRLLAFNPFRRAASTGSIATKCYCAALDEQHLLKVLQA